MKSCSFFGHRKISVTDDLVTKLSSVIENLIKNGVDIFIFGSRSQFNDLCYQIVSELKNKYQNIKRINFNCPFEYVFTSQKDKERSEDSHFKLTNKKVDYELYEEAVLSKKVISSTKNTYVMRNQEMIDNSDICIFYYDKNYLPPTRKYSKNIVFEYQPKSGTELAFKYAEKKNKILVNVYEK